MIGFIILPILYAIYLGIVLILLDELLYSGMKLTGTLSNRVLPPDIEKWWLDHGDFKTEAWFLPLENCKIAAPVFIFAHPLNTVAEHWLSDARWLKTFGFHVLLIEYPGYADSGGTPNDATIRRCMELAYDKVQLLDKVDSNRIVAVGQSLGANVACLLTETRNLAAVIMYSGFPTLGNILHKYLLPSFVTKDKFNVMPAVKTYQGPILFVQAKNDHIISIKQAKKMSNVAIDPEIIHVDDGHYIEMANSDGLAKRTKIFLQRNNLLQSIADIQVDQSLTDT